MSTERDRRPRNSAVRRASDRGLLLDLLGALNPGIYGMAFTYGWAPGHAPRELQIELDGSHDRSSRWLTASRARARSNRAAST